MYHQLNIQRIADGNFLTILINGQSQVIQTIKLPKVLHKLCTTGSIVLYNRHPDSNREREEDCTITFLMVGEYETKIELTYETKITKIELINNGDFVYRLLELSRLADVFILI